ncbi:hypothetical protein L1049_014739 [Liquidambar formosana]|uniref:Bromo domain-containing protein n=1 Tax=Liquidambar formosana TaxID=63359 RepID=A0AAP0X208_LIQFO
MENNSFSYNHHHKKNTNPYSNPNYRTTATAAAAAPASAPASTPTPTRRSTRRNPNPDEISPSEAENIDTAGEDDDESSGKRREKKLKLVLRLPTTQRSSLNSTSLNSYASDSNAEDDNAATNHKKRKINAIRDGSGREDGEKGEKPTSGAKPTNSLQGTPVDGRPSTPLPDKKLLLFVLDRLQKKDTYGVFSDPVDPKELPDYHEVIDHPMDFGTVRKKLNSGAYANLEQFEKDVFLICSNAMQYNAPDTIYFRQARSIHELAKSNFENLRQDSDNEAKPKIVRRGRPPTKNLKKSLGRPSLERTGSEFSSDATLATAGENTNWSNHDPRKGSLLSDKSGPVDLSGRSFPGSRNSEAYTGWLAEHKFERNDEFTGSMLKGNSMKHGKKQFVLDENRRNTYKQGHPSAGVREPSVLATFDREKKLLMAVGLHSEHGYARSLARFAANLGPVAWKIASKKIERSLPAGVKFGPGWVGENEVALQKPLLLPSHPPGQLSQSQPLSLPANSSAASPSPVESKGDKLSEKVEGDNSSGKYVPSTLSAMDGHPSKPLPPSASASSSPFVANRSPEPGTESAEVVKGLNPNTGFNILNSSVGAIRPRPPFQIHQSPVIHPGMNGFNSGYGFNFPAQMGKLIGAARPPGFNFQSPGMLDTISRTNTNFVRPVTANSLNSEEPKFSENSTIKPGSSLTNSGCEGLAASRSGLHPQSSWQGLSPQQKPDSVPPDLNVRFQSPGSPSSSRVDSAQPDLALQL